MLRRKNLVLKWPSFLETFMKSRRVKGASSCSVFSFELLYILHLGISKLVKECTVSYLSSGRLKTGGAIERGEVVC